MIIGASFDTVEDQLKFANAEGFPYVLISDTDRSIGRSYDAERAEGKPFAEWGVPRRVTYLIDPDGKIAVAYNVEKDGHDLAEHAAAVLADIKSRS